ncbi:MAG: RNA 2',3'-cyclic phosphodiesterase [Methanophagales archaeon ANME-1-THS]|nr:MAG: RNA 2',3'-cyclic phosphodiesterase [Methanophagales archaeon ANME-1-THS]
MRAFIAIDLSEEIRAKIEELQKAFETLGLHNALKFVDPKQAHQTVKFLGEVPDAGVERVTSALAELRHGPFAIELRGVGFFPEASRERVRTIRVIWVGIDEGAEQLRTLQEAVELKLYAVGFPLERRFSAHVTLGRVKRPLKSEEIVRIVKKIAELKDVAVGKMLVEELKLKRSTLTPNGPIYADVYVKRLVE